MLELGFISKEGILLGEDDVGEWVTAWSSSNAFFLGPLLPPFMYSVFLLKFTSISYGLFMG